MLDKEELNEIYGHAMRHDLLIKILREFLKEQGAAELRALGQQEALEGDWSHKAAMAVGKAQAYERLYTLIQQPIT